MKGGPKSDRTTASILNACADVVAELAPLIKARTFGPLESTIVCDLLREMFLVELSDAVRADVLRSRAAMLPTMHQALEAVAKDWRSPPKSKPSPKATTPQKAKR